MSCNWDLFEFRVVVLHPNHSVMPMRFWNVYPDLSSLGISDFQGSNDSCNFKSVFSELAKWKTIPFGFRKIINGIHGNPFNMAQEAERKKLTLNAAKLYVHRRNQSDLSSLTTGIGVLLDSVTIPYTATVPNYYVYLSGDKASLVNS
jgi:hypothetical protein